MMIMWTVQQQECEGVGGRLLFVQGPVNPHNSETRTRGPVIQTAEHAIINIAWIFCIHDEGTCVC